VSNVGAAITACAIVRDEAGNLRELLPTLAWANEVLVLVDEATKDDSEAVARSLGARVETRAFGSFPSFRNAALELASSPWVFFVDADERVSAALASEVRAAVQASEDVRWRDEQAPVGFWVPRHNIIFGRLVRGGGWTPDFQPRLLRRDRARFDDSRLVHEVVLFNGPAGFLTERLLHLNYASPHEFFGRQRRYTALEAQTLRAAGATFRRRAFDGQPLREFARRYLVLGGWRDGFLGLFLSVALAYYAFRRVRLVRESPGASAPRPT
jgi:glycosyltransferase involved in cell wall biosynthesis